MKGQEIKRSLKPLLDRGNHANLHRIALGSTCVLGAGATATAELLKQRHKIVIPIWDHNLGVQTRSRSLVESPAKQSNLGCIGPEVRFGLIEETLELGQVGRQRIVRTLLERLELVSTVRGLCSDRRTVGPIVGAGRQSRIRVAPQPPVAEA